MQGLRQYLTKTTSLAKQQIFGQDENAPKLRIVMGNTSCDMDSVVGSIALAYYYSLKHQEVFIPIINCKRENFGLDASIILHLIEDCKIPMENLFFYDELCQLYPTDKFTEVVLFDHNELDVSQAHLAPFVKRIVDHHVDAQLYLSTIEEKVLRFVGSACSLLATMFEADKSLIEKDLHQGQNDKISSMGLAYLIAAPIQLDSYNFAQNLYQNKWSDEDTHALKFLSEYAVVGEDFYKRLYNAKFDIGRELNNPHGPKGIFMKDYKTWSLPTGCFGCGITVASIEEIFSHFGQDKVFKQVDEFMIEKDLGIFTLIVNKQGSEGVEKGFLVCQKASQKSKIQESFDDLAVWIQNNEEAFKVTDCEFGQHQDGKWMVCKINNLKLTRKTFEAKLKNEFYESTPSAINKQQKL